MSPTDGGKIGTLPARPHRLPPAQRFLSGSWRGTSHDFTNSQGIYSLLPPSSTAHTLLKILPPRPRFPMHPPGALHSQLFRAPPSACYKLPRARSSARQDLQHGSAAPALRLHGRPVSSSKGMAAQFWGRGLAGLLRALKNKLVETSSKSFRR